MNFANQHSMNADATAPRSGFRLGKAVPTLAALLVIVVTARMGIWQLDRAAQRDMAAEKLRAAHLAPPIALGPQPLADVQAVAFYPAQARGEWVPEKVIFLDNQVYQGQAGFQILMPLRLAGSGLHVLVNRGWVKSMADRQHLPRILTAGGVQTIEGDIHPRTPRVGSVSRNAREGAIWSEVTPETFAAWSGLSMQPLILYQTNHAEDGLIRDWPAPDSGAERNRGYAVQWFALAAMTFIFWGYYFFRARIRASSS